MEKNSKRETINFDQAEKELRRAYREAMDGKPDGLQDAWDMYREALAKEQRRRIQEANDILHAYFDKLTEIRDAQLTALRQGDTARGIAELAGDEQYFDRPEPVKVGRATMSDKRRDLWEVCFPVLVYAMDGAGGRYEIALNAESQDKYNMSISDPDGVLLRALIS